MLALRPPSSPRRTWQGVFFEKDTNIQSTLSLRIRSVRFCVDANTGRKAQGTSLERKDCTETRKSCFGRSREKSSSSGIVGMGGVGKTSAMIGLGYDDDFRRRFSNGIHFLTFGQQAVASES